MSEAVILGAIQKLEIHIIDASLERTLREVVYEMRMMLDFLRDKESGERSRLNYLLADFADMAQDSVDLATNIGGYLVKNEISDVIVRDIGVVPFVKSEIFDVLDWLRKTKKRMMEFGVGGGQTETRPQSVGEDGGVVVGLEEDVRQLIGRAILNEKSGSVMSSIKGMVGVGKTTLARQVYNHAAVIEKFKCRAWVSLSSDTSMNEVLVELVKQLVELDGDLLLVEEMDNESLRQMLRQHLQGMPYFIVVDNLLPEINLHSFLKSFPRNEDQESRLLLHYIHEMKPLDSDKSWQLFFNTIFYGDQFTSDENKFSKDLERKGREMLKKCGGLPVAIVNVGRQKAKQRLLGIEWEELFDSIDLEESLKSLEPMYHRLDEELKECFLHMSFFKENAIMREEKLEQIWAVRELNTRRSIPRIHCLVSESIIDVVHEFGKMYEVKRCRMNPLLHMLSIKKAEQELGFEILRNNNENNRPSESPRHRVIHCGRDKFNQSSNQDKHLVSFIFHGGGCYLHDAGPSYWESFEDLKILDLEDFGVKTLSKAIGTLIQLRHLGLRNNYITKIPDSFGGLKKLETLDMALNFLVEVSDIIGEMVSLRHLYMSDVICLKPLKIDALQNLETLTYISIYDWAYEVSSFEKMTRLRKLGIEEVDENSDVSKLFALLAKLKSLNRLNLRGFRFKSMPCLDELGILDGLRSLKLEGLLARLPINYPRIIYYLVLVNTCLDEDPMPVLQNLPNLEFLKLRNAYTGRQMVIQEAGFLRLKILRINELWNLRNVQVGEHVMSALEQLEIKNCPHLETLPKEIGSMANLKKLKMVTTKHIARKIRNSGLTSKIVEADIDPCII